MSTAVITERIAKTSPLFKARIAGVFWLMVFLAGSLALFLGGGVAFSAANIVASLCYIVVTLLGEGSLIVWLLVKGVNVQRWKEQANAAGASIRT